MGKTDFTNDKVLSAEYLHLRQEHVHDGADENTSAPKVDLADHIGWGNHGKLEVTQDTNSLGAGDGHEITHTQTGGGAGQVSRFITDQLKSSLGVLLMGARGRIEQVVNSTLDLEFTDTNGAPIVTRLVAGALKVTNTALPPGASSIDTLVGRNHCKLVANIVFRRTLGAWVLTVGATSINVAAATLVTLDGNTYVQIDATNFFGVSSVSHNCTLPHDESVQPDYDTAPHLDVYVQTNIGTPKVGYVAIKNGSNFYLDEAAADDTIFQLHLNMW